MSAPHQIIHIHPDAPPKPALGAPCNGCGVCCLAEPCPVGMLVSRKRHGACDALVWSPANGSTPSRYHCGLMLRAAGSHGREGPLLRQMWQAWVRRLISAGSGCDASLALVTDTTTDTTAATDAPTTAPAVPPTRPK